MEIENDVADNRTNKTFRRFLWHLKQENFSGWRRNIFNFILTQSIWASSHQVKEKMRGKSQSVETWNKNIDYNKIVKISSKDHFNMNFFTFFLVYWAEKLNHENFSKNENISCMKMNFFIKSWKYQRLFLLKVIFSKDQGTFLSGNPKASLFQDQRNAHHFQTPLKIFLPFQSRMEENLG